MRLVEVCRRLALRFPRVRDQFQSQFLFRWNPEFVKVLLEGGVAPLAQADLPWPTLRGVVAQMDALGYASYLVRSGAFAKIIT